MKLITAISFLLPLLLMLCPIGSIAFRCHFCVGANPSQLSDCSEGEPTEEKECIVTVGIIKNWACSLRLSKRNGKRISLGCKESMITVPAIPTKTYCRNNDPGSGSAYYNYFYECICKTDSCNSFTSESLRCLQCKDRVSNRCMREEEENPSEERCDLNTKYCVYRKYEYGEGLSHSDIWRGCATEFREKLEYINTGNGYFCNDTYTVGDQDRECYCTTNSCNTYLNKVNPPKTESGGERHPSSSSLTFSIIISILAIAFPSNP